MKYNGKKKYLVVKDDWLGLLDEKDTYNTESILIEYSTIATSQMNKKELKINGETTIKLTFNDEGDCESVQGILLEAQKKQVIELKKKEAEEMQESPRNKKPQESDQKKEEEDNRNTYLGRRLIQNQNKNSSKNFYKLYAMNLENEGEEEEQEGEGESQEIVPKKEEEPKGFFHRLSMMFCGGSSD